MILELVILDVIPDKTIEFQQAFETAQHIIASQPGYISHQLQRCIEQGNRFVLLVSWDSVEHHMQGFRQSKDYQRWKQLLHHFYDPFPTVEHYQLV